MLNEHANVWVCAFGGGAAFSRKVYNLGGHTFTHGGEGGLDR